MTSKRFQNRIGGVETSRVAISLCKEARHNRLEPENRQQASEDHIVVVESHAAERLRPVPECHQWNQSEQSADRAGYHEQVGRREQQHVAQMTPSIAK